MVEAFEATAFQNNAFYVPAASGVNASLTATEASDTLSSAAVLPIGATSSVTEAGDALGSTASVVILANVTKTEDDDALSSTATLAAGGSVSADLSVTEEGDVLASDANITQPQITLVGGYSHKIKLEDRIREDDEQVMKLVQQAFLKLAA